MTDIKSLMIQLRELQVLLNQSDDKMKLLEAHEYFVNKSGENCTYAIKCRSLFMDMYPEVKKRIKKIYDIIQVEE